ncbi:MAG: hydrogenase maturation nickel metallochaperone HypA [Gammaproteobacteria bacterium]|nr:hydrogenase maturation nickel metallochaperone HypA [Gammaproteobacteria bacterium]
MHELSVCQALIRQIEIIAEEQHAVDVKTVYLRIGPLSGIEPALLAQAYPLASAGSVAFGAELRIEIAAVRVRCQHCHAETEVLPNRLICGECGDWHTQLIGGDEMLLTRIELVKRSAVLMEAQHV